MSTDQSGKTQNQMWGGRFEAAPSDIMAQINSSIDVDQRMWRQDIQGSKAHCQMLVKQSILTAEEGDKILKGLDQIFAEIESGSFVFKVELEDIHMNVESRLKDIIGETAGKLHTARSRNDQVATDFRLWVREACDISIERIAMLMDTLTLLSKKHEGDIMPGFTHLQVAQPVTLGMHLDAYARMLARDKSRFEDCRKRMNESPLGACALSGTGFPTDRAYTAKLLDFDQPMPSTMDAVASRDFAVEFLFCCAQTGITLSRFAEEIILWSTAQFGFLRLSDQWSSGSSIMPQKKNPDAAELVRAKTGRLNGNLLQLLTVMKALPLAYNKDMQEDKKATFESFDTLTLCLEAMKGMVESAEFQSGRMREAAGDGYATATEIADWLVRKLNMPFRDAHHVTGRIVKLAETKQVRLDQLSLADMQAIEPKIDDTIFASLDPDQAIKSRSR